MSYQCISIEQAKALIAQGPVTLVDIRDSVSFAVDHIDGAIHIDNDSVQALLDSADKTQPLLIYCYHGNSSKNAAEYFYTQGFSQSYSVDGGFERWQWQR